MMRRRTVLTAFVAALALAAHAPVLAQGYPSRAVTLVVPYPAGGPVDAVARILAEGATADLGQPVVVENRAGASGIIGAGAVAKADADGHTIVLGTNQTHATNESLIKSTPYRAAADFAPVALIAEVPHVLVARKDLPAMSVAELVKAAKAEPGKFTYGSTGNGSASHLAAELFKTKAGVDLLHVPFKGAAPMTNELVAGRLDVAFATLPSVIGQIEAGTIKALAVASTKRATALPAVPTLAEAGVAGVEADAWFALFAPRGTPASIVDKLYKAVGAALARPAAQEALARQGVTLALKGPADLGAMIPKEVEKWAEVVKVSGAKVD
ncbi:tripartite tricarboxylate transporter substrate binding protein [Chelatococcus sp. SYSU_G07232]|uniref:Tripartite tricarboxylate transporter substrate binding protein n=1 Tax=Chelatococcus albus TaxID=3047466 RepID=A0ABT7AJG4_9HYPH|nr:tripartite tricarboxylate transporter substrate binding protein [Chelatococcus sp. SYSU_G07232]MDJ1159250.1 tripartite tricarboxylate transporter substrate binding protein [Chelatococcus sp. SYSU_G07232]